MRDRFVFDFLSDQRRKPDSNGQRGLENESKVQSETSFEPTRDGWRAYQAWCKQVREKWERDD